MDAKQDLQAWVRQHLAPLLGVAPDSIVLERTLAQYGLDSVDAVLMAGEIEAVFGIEIDPAAFIQHETVDAMITALAPALERRGNDQRPP